MRMTRKGIETASRDGARVVQLPARQPQPDPVKDELAALRAETRNAIHAANRAVEVANAARQSAEAAVRSLTSQLDSLMARETPAPQITVPSQPPANVVVQMPSQSDVAAARQSAESAAAAADTAQKMVEDLVERMSKPPAPVSGKPVLPVAPLGYRFNFERDQYGRITHATVERTTTK